jgi:hypothetical protein
MEVDEDEFTSLMREQQERARAATKREIASSESALREILTERGPLARAGLVDALIARGVAIDADGQAPAHLVGYAALRGLECRIGPSREPRYALLDDWLGAVPVALDPDAALARLAARYLAAHGPAAPEDLAVWSGVGLRRARRAFSLVDGAVVATHPPAAGGRVALLGHFDPYLLGYASRDLVLDPRFARRIQAGGGFIQPAILVDGVVGGTWSRKRRREGLDITLEPFAALTHDALAGIEREATAVARFLGFRPADVRTCVRPS